MGTKPLIRCAALLVFLARSAVAQNQIFYSDFSAGPGVHRSDRDGSNYANIINPFDLLLGVSPEFPWIGYIAVDPVAQKIYLSLSYGGAGYGRIDRANFDGSALETIVPEGPALIGGIALDIEHQQLYWQTTADGVRRQNFDGTQTQTLLPPSPGDLRGLTISTTSRYIFWIRGSDIMRANLDGSGVTTLLTPPGPLYDVLADSFNRRLYWTDYTAIHSMNFDGSDPQTLMTPPYAAFDLDMDPDEGKLYWSFFGGACSANLDGTDLVCPLPLTSPGNILGIALDTGPREPKLPAAGAWALALTMGIAAVFGGLILRFRVGAGHSEFHHAIP